MNEEQIHLLLQVEVANVMLEKYVKSSKEWNEKYGYDLSQVIIQCVQFNRLAKDKNLSKEEKIKYKEKASKFKF